MSLLPRDSIKVIAESVGIENLSNEVAVGLASDVEYRLREIIQEAIKFMRHSKREKMTTEDVNNALRLRNVETLYGFSGNEPLKFVKAVGTKDLFFIDDREIDFTEIIASPLPEAPRESSLSAHWLAVEGVQPAIPQNPTLQIETGDAALKRKRAAAAESDLQVRPIVKHTLSKELQLYYEKITKAVKGTSEKVATAALNSLATDPGIQQLLPYFTQFISDEVTHNLHNLAYLKNLMRMVRALLQSNNLHIEPYLHQLMPPILTCLVGRRLCENPNEDHWELRDYAASLVALICLRFGKAYTNLQPRITKTLINAFLDLSRPLTTHYGAIVGLSSLGHYVTQLLILPNLKSYLTLLEPELNGTNAIRRLEAKKCYGALLKAAGRYLEQSTSAAYAAARSPAVKKEKEDDAESNGKEDGMEMEDGSGESEKESKKGKEKVKEEKQSNGSAAEGIPPAIPAAIVPPPEHRAALEKLMPDLTTHYRELFDIFGESLSSYLFQGVSAPICDAFL